MNILFISKLTGALWEGPNISVPAQIKAQSEIDNCFWYNMNHVRLEEWADNTGIFHNLAEYPTGRLSKLPPPFNKPDLAVVEQVYWYPFEKIINDLINEKIPYVIVPRSSLTRKAQNKKPLKKRIGNVLWFNHMITRASAIQYLTGDEQKESVGQWNVRSFVIPNGITPVLEKKKAFSSNAIRGTYVGRIEVYQKGLDMLVQAIVKLAEKLRENNFTIDLYGPEWEGSNRQLNKMIECNGIGDIVSLHEPVLGERKHEVLMNTDVFVMTSRFEGLSMGMIEALAHGLPCIATKGTNMTEEIDKYGAGWTSENSVDGIVKSLLNMLSEKNEFEQKSKGSIELANKYTWEAIARQSHDCYRTIINL